MKKKTMILMSCIGAMIVLGSLALFLWPKAPTVFDEEEIATSTESTMITESSTTQTPHDETIYIDIKGAVKHPGMYRMTENDRLYDSIQKAGGLTKDADSQRVDYAQRLCDQMTIYIPKKHEKHHVITHMPSSPNQIASQQISSSTPTDTTTSSQNKVNLNTADATQLKTLTGIGDKRAEDIIAYRNSHGPFKQIEDIKQVSGIGDKTFEKLKDQLCVS